MSTKLPFKVTVDRLSHEGQGIARHEGKVIFISSCLPGEEILINKLKKRSQYDEAIIYDRKTDAVNRIEPKCPHHAICGGCSLQHMSEHDQISFKQDTLIEHLQHFGSISPDEILPAVTSSIWGYRRKARLSVKYVHKKNKIVIGFRECNGRYVTDSRQCEVLDIRIGHKIEVLSELLSQLSNNKHIPQIEIAMGDNLTALVFRNLTAFNDEDIRLLTNFEDKHGFWVYIQPGNESSIQPVKSNENAVRWLEYSIPAHGIGFKFLVTDFIQVHAGINTKMIDLVIKLLNVQATDHVLDLFCGIGNISLPIAKYAKYVTAVEASDQSIEHARMNASNNGISNVDFQVDNLYEKLEESTWMQNVYDKIIIDPPRAGAKLLAESMHKFDKCSTLVYVSCNTATLARDAGILAQHGFSLQAAGVLNMFPHTKHVESIAVFSK